MATGYEEGAAWREQLSALVDGELDDASSLCAVWRENEHVRATWHSYQLIGDVLRSDDLAGSPTRDANEPAPNRRADRCRRVASHADHRRARRR